MALDPAWIAFIGTVCGGVGLKVAERWLDRPKERTDDATRIRDELRTQITEAQNKIDALEVEVDKWKADYYKLLEAQIDIKVQLAEALATLKARVAPPIDPSPPV